MLTHCNAGWLACVEWGTATAPVYIARERGLAVHVWVSETRPRNQGAALTAWELGAAAACPTRSSSTTPPATSCASGQVDLVIVGADRIAANGDVANKIGTYLKALAARDSDVPFYVAAPTTTFDLRAADGRGASPSRSAGRTRSPRSTGEPTTATRSASPSRLPDTEVRNWGFDVTPARLVSGFITERGLIAAAPFAIAQLLS